MALDDASEELLITALAEDATRLVVDADESTTEAIVALCEAVGLGDDVSISRLPGGNAGVSGV